MVEISKLNIADFSPDIELRGGIRYCNLRGQHKLIPHIGDMAIKRIGGIPDRLFLATRGGPIDGTELWRYFCGKAELMGLPQPKLNFFVASNYTSMGEMRERPIYYGLDLLVSKICPGERNLFFEEVIETRNTIHYAGETLRDQKQFLYLSGAFFLKSSKSEHPKMDPFIFALFDVEEWIAFAHERTDFKKTTELHMSIGNRGNEQYGILLERKYPVISIEQVMEDPNKLHLAAMSVANRYISEMGVPNIVYWLKHEESIRKSNVNDTILPVEVNEQARDWDRLTAIREYLGGLSEMPSRLVKYKEDIPLLTVPYYIFDFDNRMIIGEKPKEDEVVAVVVNSIPEGLTYEILAKVFGKCKRIDLVTMFPDKNFETFSYFKN